jgi:hypothetical protein
MAPMREQAKIIFLNIFIFFFKPKGILTEYQVLFNGAL